MNEDNKFIEMRIKKIDEIRRLIFIRDTKKALNEIRGLEVCPVALLGDDVLNSKTKKLVPRIAENLKKNKNLEDARVYLLDLRFEYERVNTQSLGE